MFSSAAVSCLCHRASFCRKNSLCVSYKIGLNFYSGSHSSSRRRGACVGGETGASNKRSVLTLRCFSAIIAERFSSRQTIHLVDWIRISVAGLESLLTSWVNRGWV
jgi:hypothetical protein